MLVAGVRYRFANGLRSAMRLWGALIVAFAIAEGLHAAPPLLAWARAWMATPLPRRLLLDGGVALAFGLVARSMFLSTVGAWGAEQLAVLPLTRWQRFAIDYASSMVFLAPPLVAMVGLCGRPEPIFVIAVAAVFGRGRGVLSAPSSAASRHLLPVGEGSLLFHEWRWLGRGGGDRLLFAIVGSSFAAAASYLAIRNNGVTSPLAVLRIESAFVAFSAGMLASAILAARNAVRPYRVIESILPLSSSWRLRTLLLTSFPLMLAPLAVIALLRFSAGAIAYGAVVFAIVLLCGEVFTRGGESVAMAVAIVAAVGGALDGRVALALALVVLPLVWRQAIIAGATSDLRVVRSEEAA
jgi:hypothetical protein